jgi:hypothetical protein
MIILVAHEGFQYPTIIFPLGSHLIQFLNCLDTALAPKYRLEPRQWERLLEISNEPVILKKISTREPTTAESVARGVDTLLDAKACLKSPTQDDSCHTKLTNFSHLSPIYENVVLTPAIMGHKRNFQAISEKSKKLKGICTDIKLRIVSRAFYGWLSYYRQVKTLKKHLLKLINVEEQAQQQAELNCSTSNELDTLLDEYLGEEKKLDEQLWSKLMDDNNEMDSFDQTRLYKLIYLNGIESNQLRKKVWPFLLEHYTFDMKKEEINARAARANQNYFKLVSEWELIEIYCKSQEEKSILMNETGESSPKSLSTTRAGEDSGLGSSASTLSSTDTSVGRRKSFVLDKVHQAQTPVFSGSATTGYVARKDLFSKLTTAPAVTNVSEEPSSSGLKFKNKLENESSPVKFSLSHQSQTPQLCDESRVTYLESEDASTTSCELLDSSDANKLSMLATPSSPVTDPQVAHLNGSIFSPILEADSSQLLAKQSVIQSFGLNMHRIDKDVHRCDRNFAYFTSTENLNKLKNILYT